MSDDGAWRRGGGACMRTAPPGVPLSICMLPPCAMKPPPAGAALNWLCEGGAGWETVRGNIPRHRRARGSAAHPAAEATTAKVIAASEATAAEAAAAELVVPTKLVGAVLHAEESGGEHGSRGAWERARGLRAPC